MDPKYTTVGKHYWQIHLNKILIGKPLDIVINKLHQHKFAYFYRYHNNSSVHLFDNTEIGKKFKEICTIDTITDKMDSTVLSYINVPQEKAFF